MYSNPIDYIKVKSGDEHNDCPLLAWYKFKGACSIESCKAYAKNSEYGCIYIDTGKINASDLPIAKVAKFKGMTTAELYDTKRKAVLRIKSVIQLYLYVAYINERYKPDVSKHYTEEVSNKIKQILHKSPIMLEEIKFDYWMLKLVVDKNEYVRFLLSSNVGKSKLKLNTILNLTTKECTSLVSLLDSKPLF